MAGRFAEKSVLIAGGTGALGRATALAFLEESAYVILTYRRQEEFVALNKTDAATCLSLEGYQVDVTDEGAVRRLTEQLLASHGRIDVLVNADGGYAGGQPLCLLSRDDTPGTSWCELLYSSSCSTFHKGQTVQLNSSECEIPASRTRVRGTSRS